MPRRQSLLLCETLTRSGRSFRPMLACLLGILTGDQPLRRERGSASKGSKDETVQPVGADRMAQLWRRLKEHRIAQWTVGYVAVAYGIQHAVILTSESYEWPNIVARVSMTLLALGLPIAMTLAWYHGERASRHFSRAELSILSALLVMSALLFYAFVRPSGEVSASRAPTAPQEG